MKNSETLKRVDVHPASIEEYPRSAASELTVWKLAACLGSLAEFPPRSWDQLCELLIECGWFALQRDLDVDSSDDRMQLLRGLLVQIESSAVDRAVRSDAHTSEEAAWQHVRMNLLAAMERCVDARRNADGQEATLRRSIYNFAYGLSHEINNPLANISARAQLLLGRAKSDEDRKALGTIIDQSRRAYEMLADAMLVVQPPKIQLAEVDLKWLLQQWEKEFSIESLPKHVSLSVAVPPERCRVLCDELSIRQAIHIAVRNAKEACQPGNSIQVQGGIGMNDDGEVGVIRIVDNGPGLSPKRLAHVWDLYYSGREAGRGLGIGLAKLKRIVEANHGSVRLDCGIGSGVTIEIHLPFVTT